MNDGTYVFSQLMGLIHRQAFARIVEKFGGNDRIHDAGAYFVIRAKKNMSFERIYSETVDKESGLRCDQTVRLKGFYAAKQYPEKLRRIKYLDSERQLTYVYLTNHFEAKATQIVQLYVNRWKVELFFKWIKQHLRIKRFWGESTNAVKTQIWIAICTFVLVAIWKKKSKSLQSMNELLQIISVSAFDKTPVNQLFNHLEYQKFDKTISNQLNMFDL